MSDKKAPPATPSHIKMDETRKPGGCTYRGHKVEWDTFGYKITFNGEVVAFDNGTRAAANTHEQRAKQQVDTLCRAYAISL